jgi:hypothetical protein
MKKPATIETRNDDLKVGDWIWIRGQKVRVVEAPVECKNPLYITVLVQNMRGGRWLERMARHHKRKRVVL